MTDKTSRSKPKVPDKADDKEQSERFIEAARELDADTSRKQFEETFKGISKPQRPKRTSN